MKHRPYIERRSLYLIVADALVTCLWVGLIVTDLLLPSVTLSSSAFLAGICSWIALSLIFRRLETHMRSRILADLRQHQRCLCPYCLYPIDRERTLGTCPECGADLAEHDLPQYWRIHFPKANLHFLNLISELRNPDQAAR